MYKLFKILNTLSEYPTEINKHYACIILEIGLFPQNVDFVSRTIDRAISVVEIGTNVRQKPATRRGFEDVSVTTNHLRTMDVDGAGMSGALLGLPARWLRRCHNRQPAMPISCVRLVGLHFNGFNTSSKTIMCEFAKRTPTHEARVVVTEFGVIA